MEHSSSEKLVAIALGLLAVLSPLYIDRKPPVDPEIDCEGGGLILWLPLVLILLVIAINVTYFLDRRFMRFDPYWIHRVGGSSCGIVAILFVLILVLWLKSSL
ncbi:hypothetical protein J5N97_006826 [Dioscorea zingiberensis]|uniref:Transmembrane protein n=1 Tax=Dioscorea zingiberensis TaxID=325984 RepID=A0A9D5HT25_9LILI|nr:hypothetical protein J5N97_006826 [Dioscorea zingiberensis]